MAYLWYILNMASDEIKSNFHTHTELCRHAKGKPADYAQEAVNKGLSILGFSDHAPFFDTDYGYRMMYDELDLYISLVQSTKEDFSDKLEILQALEIEWLPRYMKSYKNSDNYYEWLLTQEKMDYLLLGEHFFEHNENLINITSISSTQDAVIYANEIKEALNTGYFKILAHPDIFTINEDWGWNEDYQKATDIIIEAAIKTNVLLEYNANGLRRGIKTYPDGERWQYPHKRFWDNVKQAGLPCIVGSDCHSPKALWDDNVLNSIRNIENLRIKREKKLK